MRVSSSFDAGIRYLFRGALFDRVFGFLLESLCCYQFPPPHQLFLLFLAENPHYKKQLTLLFLDLKISTLPASMKAKAGEDLAKKVIADLYENGDSTTKIQLLLSIGHVYDYDFVLGFQNEIETQGLQGLSDRIGWDVGLNDNINDIINMWNRVEVIHNVWQGDGTSNCMSPFYNLGRLTTAIKKRDDRNHMIKDPIIDKVYHWTIDLHHNLRASLR